jgi:hypothetical protein
MANPRLKWTPKGEAATEQIDLTMYGDRGLQQLSGWRRTDQRGQVSAGGKAVTLAHDAWFEYDLRLNSISRSGDATIWALLTAFTAHVNAGGLFEFSIDNTKTLVTTLTSQRAKGVSIIAVADETGIVGGDDLLLEDVVDPTRWQLVRTTTPGAGLNWNISPPLTFTFAAGTSVYAFEHFPLCKRMGRGARLLEHKAGDGLDLWDLRLQFRTVR